MLCNAKRTKRRNKTLGRIWTWGVRTTDGAPNHLPMGTQRHKIDCTQNTHVLSCGEPIQLSSSTQAQLFERLGEGGGTVMLWTTAIAMRWPEVLVRRRASCALVWMSMWTDAHYVLRQEWESNGHTTDLHYATHPCCIHVGYAVLYSQQWYKANHAIVVYWACLVFSLQDKLHWHFLVCLHSIFAACTYL